jgi:eukaryotic-like serine/threonine-protein kinase
MDEQGHSDTLPPGTVLAGTPHVIRQKLGRGGMGVVYETARLDDGARQAVKVLSRHAAGDPALEERLLLEAAGLGELRSRHIVGVQGVGRLATGEVFYEMDLLKGETLRETLGYGPLEPSYACGLVYQALGALGAVHRAGFVHRDVKPDNLFWCSDGRCVLLDFGTLKVLTDLGRFPPRRFPTDKRKALGTARYLPPEAGRRAPDARADLFAAGAVLAELLAGEWALEHLDNRDYLDWVNAYGFPMPDGIPEGLRPVIRRATASDPDQRYPSAAEFAAELGWACQDAGIDLASVRPPPERPRWLDEDEDETPGSPTPTRTPTRTPTPPAGSEVPEASGERPITSARESSDDWPAASARESSDDWPAAPALVASDGPVPRDVTSPPAPLRPRRASRTLLVSAALGAAGIAAGAVVSLAASSWTGPFVVMQVANEPRRAQPAGGAASAFRALETSPQAPVGAEALAPRQAPASTSSASASASSASIPASVAERQARLEARLKAGRGTVDDVRELAGLCAATSDSACRERALDHLKRLGGFR